MSERATWVGLAIAALLLLTLLLAAIKGQDDHIKSLEGKYCLIIKGEPVSSRCVESTIIFGGQ